MEQGKDVITTSGSRTEVRAYQLKAGRLNLSEWRKFRPEIIELVEYPIEHPSIKSNKRHTSFLVTNAGAADTVINAIKSENRGWKLRRRGELHLITSAELVSRFVKAHGKFLPSTPGNFGVFLNLIVKTGADPLDKELFSSFLETILPFDSKVPTFRDIQRAVASAVLLTTYITQGSQRLQNHWAVFEAWVVLGSYILGLQEKYAVPARWWGQSFELVELAAVRALEELYAESEQNETMFVQGSPLIDGHFYTARITILAGLLSSLSLYHHLKKTSWNGHKFVRENFIEWYLPHLKMWGESAVPYLLLATIVLERSKDATSARKLIAGMVRSISEVNGPKGKGIPNPYYEAEAALRLQLGLGLPTTETFNGYSYCLEPLILWATRRGMRPQLERFWPDITRLCFADFRPSEKWEIFRWRARTGRLHTKIPNSPQSWPDLIKSADEAPDDIPAVLAAKPEFAIFFAMVFPHRLSSGLLRAIDLACH